MKQLKLLLLLIFLPFTVMAIDNQITNQLPELDELTKSSMKRTATTFTDSQGTINLDTSNSYRSTTFVRINKDGTKETLCTTSETEAKEFMAGKSVKPHNEGE